MSIQSLNDLISSSSALSACDAWSQLSTYAVKYSQVPLYDLVGEPDRYQQFSQKSCGLHLDVSRQRLGREVIESLVQLAEERHLSDWVEHLFKGSPVNNTENRPALHMALRSGCEESLIVDGQDLIPLVETERKRMLSFAADVRDGRYSGHTGKRITDVVNIGIGGSDLGLEMVVTALAEYRKEGLETHFISNIDGTELTDCLSKVNPATTLFIICSKSFVTEETKLNSEAARSWFLQHCSEQAIAQHFVAVSTNDVAMDAFGVSPEMRFNLWDWVGGRYSLWSSVGLAIALAIGPENYKNLLSGAAAMDEHFKKAPFGENLPVLLGLLGIWNQNFLGLSSHAILPYTRRLSAFPAYLQQLEMESNGKSVTRNGKSISYPTCPIIWGEPGSNAQHSFFQLLHQGTVGVSLDFIAPKAVSSATEQHLKGLINMLAQADAFAEGYTSDQVIADLQSAGNSESAVEAIFPHKIHRGNQPSTIVLLDRLTPENLGALIALYEHKVFVQGVIWGVNSFDQWGVERGKVLARKYEIARSESGGSEGLPPIWREIG